MSKRRAVLATRVFNGGLTTALMVLVVLMVLPFVVEMRYLGPKLSHLAVDDQTGLVFVGGRSRTWHR